MNWRRLLARQRLGRAAAAAERDASRSDFQRDFDRIVFSSALRRLQDKTQVFPLSQSDYVRTRLTHSLEVASVGRSLGVMIGAGVAARDAAAAHPQEFGAIVAAACLAHDIGNPPFGHAGEDAIRLWFAESALAARALQPLDAAEREDFLHFEGNAQGFRLLARIQNPDNPGGLQLTAATLGAFSKYPRGSLPSGTDGGDGDAGQRKFGYFQADQEWFEQVAAQLGLTPLAGVDGAWRRHPLAYAVEAADDICYLIIDVEDAYRLRRLSYSEALSLLAPLVASRDLDRLAALRGDAERIELLRAKAIGRLIDQAGAAFLEHEAAILAGDGRFRGELLHHVPAAAALRELQALARQQIYFSPEVVSVGAAGFQVLAGLLEAFVGAVEDVHARGDAASSKSRMLLPLLLPQFAALETPPREPYRRLLAVTDAVTGLSDSQALRLYRKITGISLPGSGVG